MRTPRSIDILGISALVASLGLWWSYSRSGEARALLAFFAVAGAGIALDPITRYIERRRARRLSRTRHPVLRGENRRQA